MHIRQVKFSISLFLLAFVIFLFTLKGFTTTVLADEDTTVETVATYNYNKVPADTLATIKDIVANDNTISMKVKDGYLILTKVYSNSPELENHPNDPLASSKWKTAAAQTVVKVAVPILKRFAKKAGVKLGDHALGNITAILTGVEDNVQDRLYKTLRNIGFSKYWAGVTSRAIVFALF